MSSIAVIHSKPAMQQSLGTLLRKVEGWSIASYASLAAAEESLHESPGDLVVIELGLAAEDQCQPLKRLLAEQPKRPVLLIGGEGTVSNVVACLQAGAAGFVPNARLDAELIDNARRVLAAASRDKSQTRLLGCMTSSCSTFVLDNDPALVATVLARFQASVAMFGVCDSAARTRLGIALEEAISNALYHGNLGLDSDLRREGIDAYYAAAAERRRQPPYCDRKIFITERINHQEAVFVIRDQGRGFNVAKVNADADPENLEAVSGRGLMLIQAFMDEVRYNATGNEVTLTKRNTPSGVMLAA